jgi:hypothetical protein
VCKVCSLNCTPIVGTQKDDAIAVTDATVCCPGGNDLIQKTKPMKYQRNVMVTIPFFDTNWFALINGYFSFVFLFKFLKIKQIKLYYLFYTCHTFALSHIYSWTMVAVVTVWNIIWKVSLFHD